MWFFGRNNATHAAPHASTTMIPQGLHTPAQARLSTMVSQGTQTTPQKDVPIMLCYKTQPSLEETLATRISRGTQTSHQQDVSAIALLEQSLVDAIKLQGICKRGIEHQMKLEQKLQLALDDLGLLENARHQSSIAAATVFRELDAFAETIGSSEPVIKDQTIHQRLERFRARSEELKARLEHIKEVMRGSKSQCQERGKKDSVLEEHAKGEEEMDMWETLAETF